MVRVYNHGSVDGEFVEIQEGAVDDREPVVDYAERQKDAVHQGARENSSGSCVSVVQRALQHGHEFDVVRSYLSTWRQFVSTFYPHFLDQ